MLKKVLNKISKLPPRTYIGIGLMLLSAVVAVWFYGRLYWQRAFFTPKNALVENQNKIIYAPINFDFSLIIPKLNINAPVVADVSGTEPNIYYTQLKKGAAHYKGTPTPDANGNTVIFGHSSFIPSIHPGAYNTVFLMLDKLQKDDQIIVYYKSKPYYYKVQSINLVSDSDLSILQTTDHKQLTIMTCWPPGTDLKRLVIIAAVQS